MKEIDLLPEWYKSSKRRQFGYRTQYIILGSLFFVMVVWNFIASYSVSKAQAELVQLEFRQSRAESVLQQASGIKDEVTDLGGKADILQAVDSKIDIADVLAEISFLLDENIVLSRMVLEAESLVNEKQLRLARSSAVVAAQSKYGDKEPFFRDARFKVVVQGVAADAGDVAEWICRLEDSPYFFQVIPSFSRNKVLQTTGSTSEGPYQVSEFEVVCYLANYQLQKLASSKTVGQRIDKENISYAD